MISTVAPKLPDISEPSEGFGTIKHVVPVDMPDALPTSLPNPKIKPVVLPSDFPKPSFKPIKPVLPVDISTSLPKPIVKPVAIPSGLPDFPKPDDLPDIFPTSLPKPSILPDAIPTDFSRPIIKPMVPTDLSKPIKVDKSDEKPTPVFSIDPIFPTDLPPQQTQVFSIDPIFPTDLPPQQTQVFSIDPIFPTDLPPEQTQIFSIDPIFPTDLPDPSGLPKAGGLEGASVEVRSDFTAIPILLGGLALVALVMALLARPISRKLRRSFKSPGQFHEEAYLELEEIEVQQQ